MKLKATPTMLKHSLNLQPLILDIPFCLHQESIVLQQQVSGSCDI